MRKKNSKTLIAVMLLLSASITKAQTIPNAGFENWSNPNGFNVPNDWGNLNDITSFSSIYTCTKGTPGNPGASYLKLISKIVTGMGVKPGIAVSGVLNENTLTPFSGFAYSLRPDAFTGKWQYMGNSSNDIGYIKVFLTKWNSSVGMHDTIGYASQNLNGMVMSWANFSFPFTYNSTDNPDSCIILLNASGPNPEAGSYLYVDNLSFSGVLTGVENVEATGIFNVFPNPSNQTIQLDLSGLNSKAKQFEIADITGKVIKTQNSNGSLVQTISIAELDAGNYFLKIYSENGIVTNRIIKQ